jgi:dolichol-phosphate mannosyltransferase
MKLVSIVVPVFHNSASLHDLLTRFQNVVEKVPEDFEFIFVDDGSADDSFQKMEELVRRDTRVKAIKLARNFGSDSASAAGIAHSRGDAVVALSADLQDPPELIIDMLKKWREGYRIVLAARAEREDPWLGKQFSHLFWKLFRKYAIPNMPERGCDFVLIDRLLLETLKDMHEVGGGLPLVLWTGFKPAIVYYNRARRDEKYGPSMWSYSKKVTYLIDSFVRFSHMPIRAASLMGFVLAFLGMIYAASIVYSRLFLGVDLPGWPSLMVVFLVVSGVQLIMIGILGEYIVRTLESTRRRPPYVIEKVVDQDPKRAHQPLRATHDQPSEPASTS